MSLVICEKSIAAKRIATILSNGKAKQTSDRGVAIFTFSKNGQTFTVIGLQGHIINLDFPSKYNAWQKVKPRELVNQDPEKKVSGNRIADKLRKLGKTEDEVIIATDFDREGELIGVEGLEIVQSVNPKIKAKRARFSALTKEEVTHAFQNLADIDFNLSQAAFSRQIIDLAWGASLTRFISLASNQVGKDFLSVGRVQSPTLALIVDKEKERIAFKPTPYWEIIASVKAEKERAISFKVAHKKGRFLKGKDAQTSFEQVKDAKYGEVSDLTTKKKTEKPPEPFNTTSFIRAVNKLGYTAASAMSIAEDLYTQGFISYPRTDNTVYPKSLNLKEILEKFSSSPFFGDMAEELLTQKKLTPTKGKKMTTDHPPIHPVESAMKGDIVGKHWTIYEMIVRRFFATLAPDAHLEHGKASVDINGEPFIGNGVRVLEPGWQKYYTYGIKKAEPLPPLSIGDRLLVGNVDLFDKETQPPNRYSQGGLIQEMDSLGLGTKSTRHEIIQKLYNRGYIEGSPPVPTPTGFAVMDALEQYAEVVAKPDMTAKLEDDMSKIAEGKAQLDEVVSESREMLTKAFDVLEKNKSKIGSSIQKALRSQSILGKCPKCGADLITHRSARGKRFVGCSRFPKCRNSYPLPQQGKITPNGSICPRCRAPEINLFSKGKRPRLLCLTMNCSRQRDEEANANGKTIEKS